MTRDRSAASTIVQSGSGTKASDASLRITIKQVLTVSVLLFIACAQSAAAQDRTNHGALLVRISEVTIDNEHGVTATDCMLVLPDGGFHLERRKQKLPNPTASLKIFESSLDTERFQQLRDILNDDTLQNLPPYALPTFPMNNLPWFSDLEAEIPRGPTVKRVGYWVWRGGASDRSPNSTPDDIKRSWQESETALRPLLDWFHGVEALRLTSSDSKSNMCGAL
jgi:hypothetical protein